MTTGAVTGGRDHWPTLAEIEQLEAEVKRRGISKLREGGCPTGVDRIVRGYLRARGSVEIETWPADWEQHGRAAGPIRNRAMLEGDPPDLLGHTLHPSADVLFAFEGGRGTADCREAAGESSVEVVEIAPAPEPRVWNMYHRWSEDQGQPPGLVYVGRSRQWGGPSPLANPYRVELRHGEDRAAAAPRILRQYREWLWGKIQAEDLALLEVLDAISPESYLGCTCWPAHCHAEVVVRAWRWRNGSQAQRSA
jgi:hypothetical protein